MQTNGGGQMDPRVALDRAHRVSAGVRRQGRWHGWVWLAIGVLTPMFLLGTTDGVVLRGWQLWVAVALMAAGAVLAVWETRRGVLGREAAAVDTPFTWAYVASMVAVAVVVVVFAPVGPPGWFVAVALVPSVPCLVAAWRILSR